MPATPSTPDDRRVAAGQRRAAREAAERADAAGRARRRRGLRLAAVALLAAAVVAAGALLSASGSRPGRGGAMAAGGPEAAALVAGLRERDGVLGDPGAPLTVTEYVDLQCPACARAAAVALPALVRDHVRTGRVRLRVRVLSFLGPDSERAARVAAGAERQGRLVRFLSVFYANQGAENSGYATDAFLRQVAATAGVDAGAALAQAGSASTSRRLAQADAAAARVGVTGTPTLTVARFGGPERLLAADAQDPASVARALDAMTARTAAREPEAAAGAMTARTAAAARDAEPGR